MMKLNEKLDYLALPPSGALNFPTLLNQFKSEKRTKTLLFLLITFARCFCILFSFWSHGSGAYIMFVHDETQFSTHRDPLCKTIAKEGNKLWKFNKSTQVHFTQCFTFITCSLSIKEASQKELKSEVLSRVSSKCCEEPEECVELENVK